MAEGVFISYRRDDAPGQAGRLYDRLVHHFGADRVFMDIDSIDPGADFIDVIEATLAESGVVIVVIGPQWARAKDHHGANRLASPSDFVGLEVRRALELRKRVIPVLVSGAAALDAGDLPVDLQPLTRRNAFVVSDLRFHADVDRLAAAIRRQFASAPTAIPLDDEHPPGEASAPLPPPARPSAPIEAEPVEPPVAARRATPGPPEPSLSARGPSRRLVPILVGVGALLLALVVWLLARGGDDGSGGASTEGSSSTAAPATNAGQPTATSGPGQPSSIGQPVPVGDLPTGSEPVDVEVVDDYLWVLTDQTVQRYDVAEPASPPSVTVPLTRGASSDIIAADDRLFVTRYDDKEVLTIDAVTGEQLNDPIPVPGRPLAGTMLGDTLWLTLHGPDDGAAGAVVAIPIRDGEASEPIPLPYEANGIVTLDEELWMTYPTADGLGSVNPGSNQETTAVSEPFAVGALPVDVLAIDGKLWVTLGNADKVVVVDPSGNESTVEIPVGLHPWKLATGFDAVWVTNQGDHENPGSVSRIDATTRQQTHEIPAGVLADEIAIAPNEVLVANRGDHTVTRISPES